MVATLAAQFIVVWIIQRVPWFGAGSHGTTNTPPVALGGWTINTAQEQYYFALGIVALLTLFGRNLVRSRVGRAWMAIRDRDVAAEIMGISMLRYKLLAFTVSSFYAGVAGALIVFAWTGAATIEEFNLQMSIHILGMVIIGGLGSVLGSYLGASFVILLPITINVTLHWFYGLTGGKIVSAAILANTEHVVFGSLILFFLIAEPLGLAKLLRNFKEYLRLWPFAH
jgi:branched-chain amino acid transport system permease protein